jgi:glycerol-3-phosphate dehydrogenase
VNGKIFYNWPADYLEEDLRLLSVKQLGAEPYDLAIIGAGVVGCALAYCLSHYQLQVLLIDSKHDVGEGSSKGNSAIVHTGFDATPGTLEAQLVTSASRRWPELAQKLKIPFKESGALVIAVDDTQKSKLLSICEKAIANGVDDVQRLNSQEVKQLEPYVTDSIQGGLLVPRESIADPFTTSIAFAELALQNGVDILLGSKVVGFKDKSENIKVLVTDDQHHIPSCRVINAAGLGGRDIADQYGGAPFDINPRRGQFLIFDKSCQYLTKRILLPTPSAKTKGVLVIPSIFGNILAGPTAEDLPLGSPECTSTSKAGLNWMLETATKLCPNLPHQPIIGTYAGARCNCAQGSYQIHFDDGFPGFLTVAGIRSTGFTSAICLAEYLLAGLRDNCGLKLMPDPEAVSSRPDSCWPGWFRKPLDNEDLLADYPDYAHMTCYCEQISQREIINAIKSPLQPRTIDAIRRRTRAAMGRCQGFDCRIKLAEIISQTCSIPFDKITQNGPGSEIL